MSPPVEAVRSVGTALELLAQHAPGDLVAFGGDGSKTAADLLVDAGRVAAALPPSFAGSHALLVFEADRYAMAAALLGAFARGHAVALPPNSRRDSILAVHERPETAVVVHDTDAGHPVCIDEVLGGAASPDPPPTPLAAPVAPPPGVIATVFTSGTTGPMTAWPKTAAELLGEARMLGNAFGIGPGDRIVGGVAPGHIYGLLFTILLPMLHGAAFSREAPHHAESVARCVGDAGASVLVTVPAQLRALGALGEGALGGLRRVFSSTGPLPDPVAADFEARHGLVVTEILGSTETGGIAWRERGAAPAPAWQPFEEVGVSVGAEGRLRVDSPFVHPALPRPFETADLVELQSGGRFVHLGRIDGIVKIGGRRVAVQDVEDQLRAQPGVRDAAVVAVPVDGTRGHQLLAAVVPASIDCDALKPGLLERFEPTCLPRRILAVDALPREDNGKVPRDRLLRLFGLRPDGRPANWTLEWGAPVASNEGGRERLEIAVRVPEDYAWFEGHFEEYPVLAGAAQLKELILPTVARAFPELGPVESMSRIKFTGRITPGNALSVAVERGARSRSVHFEIRKADEVCSRGILSLAETGGA